MKFLRRFFERKPHVEKIDVTKRFNLIGGVGQGSMSKVFKSIDTLTGRTVALKILDLDKTARFEARFPGLKKPSEGEIAIQLDHPNIVKTFEYGWTTKNEQFLVMEFIEGVSLSFLVDMQNEQMKSHRLSYIIQLAEALNYFHRQNWIHRDICPRNIMVSNENQIKLIDFGLVVPNTPEFRKPGNRTGTASYMAPELIKRQPTDQRIDIFSYSVTIYEMYTKRLPWEAAETLDAVTQHINKPPTDIRELVPALDEDIADVIMRGLERYPADRWSSMDQIVNRLRDVQDRVGNQDLAG